MPRAYPEHLLARDPAPPYTGEGPFGLWHFSEDPSLGRLLPHVPRTNPSSRPYVWAIDTRHAPMFWFPRDCPRGCVWTGADTTDADREYFFGATAALRIHVIEGSWLARVTACTVFAYGLPVDSFTPHDVGGYWVSEEPVDALERVAVDDLLGRHVRAGIEVRIAPSILAFWGRVTASTLEYSGLRLRNATR